MSALGAARTSSAGFTAEVEGCSAEAEWDERWFAQISTHIVGAAHYDAEISDREEVSFDGKKVMNANRQQIGWFPKEISQVLARFVSGRGLTVHIEGLVPRGAKNKFKIPLDLQVYGRPEDGDFIWKSIEEIENEKCQFAGLVVIKAPISEGIRVLDLEERLSQKEAKESLKGLNFAQVLGDKKGKQVHNTEDMFDLPVPYDQMPMADSPKGLRAELLEHQSKALAWMLTREKRLTAEEAHRNNLPCIWARETNGKWRNKITNATASTPPQLPRGGVLADDMGMGKTMTMLSLIASEQRGGTLIVCPLSLLTVWETHLRDFAPELSVYICHGSQKQTNERFLREYHVVLTTYGTVLSLQDLLQKIKWYRIVLDEAHEVRNAKTAQASACRNLEAEVRWCITGTPLFNGLKDLYGLMAFLRIEPFCEHKWWRRTIERPAKVGNTLGFIRLCHLLGAFLLRRTKTTQVKGADGSLRRVLELPEKLERVEYVPLDTEDKDLYDRFYLYAVKQLELQYDRATSGTINLTNPLCLLTQLRQLCCSSQLLPDDIRKTLLIKDGKQCEDSLNSQLACLAKTQRGRLLEQVADIPGTECSICCDLLCEQEICFTPCLHLFHRSCLLDWLKSRHGRQRCPLCNSSCQETDVSSLPDAESLAQAAHMASQPPSNMRVSAKLCWATDFLSQKIVDHKVVVFSHSVRFLEMLAQCLSRAAVSHVKIFGDMAASRRKESMENFQNDSKVRVILCSVRVAGMGLTLTAGDIVLLLDPWWNKPVEQQAIDRVHRIGQKRAVEVVRLVAKDTVEEQMLAIQAVKHSVFERAMSKKADQSQQSRLDVVLKIFRGPWATPKKLSARKGVKRKVQS